MAADLKVVPFDSLLAVYRHGLKQFPRRIFAHVIGQIAFFNGFRYHAFARMVVGREQTFRIIRQPADLGPVCARRFGSGSPRHFTYRFCETVPVGLLLPCCPGYPLEAVLRRPAEGAAEGEFVPCFRERGIRYATGFRPGCVHDVLRIVAGARRPIQIGNDVVVAAAKARVGIARFEFRF